MNNVPPSVRAALKRRGADAILNQEGEYANFKSQIDKIIHGGDAPDRIYKSDYNEEYDEDLSPEEQKANDRIEELGDKYGMSGMTDEEKQLYESHKDEIEFDDDLADKVDEHDRDLIVDDEDDWDDENLSPMEKSLFSYKPKPLTDEQKELVKQVLENGFTEKEDINIPYHKDSKGKIIGEHGDVVEVEYTTKDGITRKDQFYKEEIEKANEKKQSNWYDNLDDSDKHAAHYKDAAMKVNPERAALIAAAMDEYIAEKPQRGFITNDQMKRYGERLGLPQMSDRDLRLMWDDVNNVGGYRGFGTPYDKGGRELEDARSAFAEVVNQEARNRKAKGNYFPYNDEDIEGAKSKILDIIRPHEGYDLDYAEAYMTRDELDEIERLADQYHLTADDLAKLSRHLDPNGMGYRMKGWESPEVKDRNSTAKQMREMLKLAGDEVEEFLNGLDKKSYDKLVSMLKSKRM